MRSVRARRRGGINLRRVTLGDWIAVLAGLMAVVSLFMTWFTLNTPRPHGEWAFTYSEIASVVVIVIFLATLFLVVYPVVAVEAGLPPLPFASPVLFLGMGGLLLLLFTYEIGKYGCVECTGTSRGFGVWVGWIASWVFLIGAVIKWGSRLSRTYS